ncbi:MAG: trigger factor [Paludibacteraceae bacterium]|nr:trigger factor [Paludibacteraceae bacterium]
MNVSQNNKDSVNATLSVHIAPADYAEKWEQSLKNFRKKANMPGFRPGCVPVGLVKKMYGRELLAEEVNRILSTALYDYIKEKNLNILGEPLPTEGVPAPTIEEGAEMDFSFDIALAPEFKIDLTKKNKVKYYTIQVAQDMVDKQVSALRGRFGNYVPADQVEEKDVVKGELVELDGTKVKEDGVKNEGAILSPNYMKSKTEQKKVIGKKVGETFKFNPRKAYDNDAEVGSLTGLKGEDAKNFNADCQFTVKEITRFAEAELNQDFFDKAYGKGNVKSEKELNEKVKSDLAGQFVADSDIKFLLDMRSLVLGKMKDLVFPDDFLKRWLKASNEKLTDAQIEEEYPKMIEDLKWQLAKDQLAQENGIKIEEADVRATAKRLAKAQFVQYGMFNAPDDILENYADSMIKDKEGIRQATDRALEDKVVAALKEKITLDNAEVSFEEFNKLFETK